MGGAATRGRIQIGWPAEIAESAVDENAVTDVHFELRGATLPIDHGLALFEELARLAPWLRDEELAGVHPVNGADSGLGQLILNRRTRMVVRIPSQRLDDLLVLSGQEIVVAGVKLAIGAGKTKALPRYTPLYSHIVTTGSSEEGAFARDVMTLLDELGIDTRFICGRQQQVTTTVGRVAGYSLMLHGLPIEHAIRIQQVGLGGNRKIGCGIFIPHKSIAALV